MKDNFKFKKSYYVMLCHLSDKQAGEFIKKFGAYVFNGDEFNSKDEYLKGLFPYFKREMEQSAMNSENGRKGGLKSAELRRNAERRNSLGDAFVTGGVLAGRTIEKFVRTLKEEPPKDKNE